MSGYILCRIPRAKVPFYLESISTNVYSIEELCYFLQNDLPLVDETVVNEELFAWLDEELGCRELRGKLQGIAEREQASIWEYVYAIFREINYLSGEEGKAYARQAAELDAQPPHIRLKQKGDSLVENGIYVNALKVYQEILEQYKDDEDVKPSFLGSVCHNAGCAYSYLFQKEEALDCFEKAYSLLHTGRALRSYLYAYYMAKTPIEYMSRLAEMGIDEQTRREVQHAIDMVQNSDQPPVLDHQIDGILKTMMQDYHRSTGA